MTNNIQNDIQNVLANRNSLNFEKLVGAAKGCFLEQEDLDLANARYVAVLNGLFSFFDLDANQDPELLLYQKLVACNICRGARKKAFNRELQDETPIATFVNMLTISSHNGEQDKKHHTLTEVKLKDSGLSPYIFVLHSVLESLFEIEPRLCDHTSKLTILKNLFENDIQDETEILPVILNTKKQKYQELKVLTPYEWMLLIQAYNQHNNDVNLAFKDYFENNDWAFGSWKDQVYFWMYHAASYSKENYLSKHMAAFVDYFCAELFGLIEDKPVMEQSAPLTNESACYDQQITALKLKVKENDDIIIYEGAVPVTKEHLSKDIEFSSYFVGNQPQFVCLGLPDAGKTSWTQLLQTLSFGNEKILQHLDLKLASKGTKFQYLVEDQHLLPQQGAIDNTVDSISLGLKLQTGFHCKIGDFPGEEFSWNAEMQNNISSDVSFQFSQSQGIIIFLTNPLIIEYLRLEGSERKQYEQENNETMQRLHGFLQSTVQFIEFVFKTTHQLRRPSIALVINHADQLITNYSDFRENWNAHTDMGLFGEYCKLLESASAEAVVQAVMRSRGVNFSYHSRLRFKSLLDFCQPIIESAVAHTPYINLFVTNMSQSVIASEEKLVEKSMDARAIFEWLLTSGVTPEQLSNPNSSQKITEKVQEDINEVKEYINNIELHFPDKSSVQDYRKIKALVEEIKNDNEKLDELMSVKPSKTILGLIYSALKHKMLKKQAKVLEAVIARKNTQLKELTATFSESYGIDPISLDKKHSMINRAIFEEARAKNIKLQLTEQDLAE